MDSFYDIIILFQINIDIFIDFHFKDLRSDFINKKKTKKNLLFCKGALNLSTKKNKKKKHL